MSAAAEQTEKVFTDLKRVVHDSEELLQDSTEVLVEKAYDLHDRLARMLELAKITGLRLQEKARKEAKAADEVIRAHPYQAIGFALGVGVLVGALVARK